MERIPMYARGGAVIPMWSDAPASTAGYHPSAIELHLFVPGSDATHHSLLQEDDGLTLAAMNGARYRTIFEVTRAGNHVTIRAEVDGDGYPDFAREAFHLFVHGAVPATVQLDGRDVTPTSGRFVLPTAARPFVVEFDL
jgi:alpha-glucosidase